MAWTGPDAASRLRRVETVDGGGSGLVEYDVQRRPVYDEWDARQGVRAFSQSDRPARRTMNAVFGAGLVATPVLVGAGATLLGVGLHRKRRGVQAVVPTATRNFAGLTVRRRS